MQLKIGKIKKAKKSVGRSLIRANVTTMKRGEYFEIFGIESIDQIKSIRNKLSYIRMQDKVKVKTRMSGNKMIIEKK